MGVSIHVYVQIVFFRFLCVRISRTCFNTRICANCFKVVGRWKYDKTGFQYTYMCKLFSDLRVSHKQLEYSFNTRICVNCFGLLRIILIENSEFQYTYMCKLFWCFDVPNIWNIILVSIHVYVQIVFCFTAIKYFPC